MEWSRQKSATIFHRAVRHNVAQTDLEYIDHLVSSQRFGLTDTSIAGADQEAQDDSQPDQPVSNDGIPSKSENESKGVSD